jgi:hypothetical protein
VDPETGEGSDAGMDFRLCQKRGDFFGRQLRYQDENQIQYQVLI